MALWNEKIDKTVDWGGDASTGFLKVKGSRVQEYIQESLDGKAGFFYYDQDNNRYLVFADEINKDKYLEDPVANSTMLIATFDAPFNYSASITLIDTESIKYIKYGSTGNYINASYDIVNKTGDSTGDNATFTITVRNGSSNQKIIRTVSYGSQLSLNIDEYLKEGTNIINVSLVGNDTLAATSVGLTYYVINLSLTDTMDISIVHDVSQPETKLLTIPYTVSGSGVKRMEWFIDGEKLPYATNGSDDISELLSSRSKSIDLSEMNLAPGRHNLQYRAYVEIDNGGVRFYSETLFRDFIVYDSTLDSNIIVVGFSTPTEIEDYNSPTTDAFADAIDVPGAVQYIGKPIQYAVFTTQGTSVIDITANNSTQSYNVVTNEEYEYSYTGYNIGDNSIVFTFGETNLYINAIVDKSSYSLTSISDTTFEFSGSDRTNNSSNKASWTFKNSDNVTYHGTLEGFEWSERSGWMSKGLMIPEGASFTTDFAPMNRDCRQSGATYEFEFETVRVKDDNVVICDLRTGNTGILITASEASFTSEDGVTVSTKYKSGESIRVSFVVNGVNSAENPSLVFIYINGILAGAVPYASTDRFISNKNIVFTGSNSATVILKQIRCYARALTMGEIVNNFILYRPTIEELVEAYDRNDILEGGFVSTDKLAARTPIIIVTGNVDKLQGFGRDDKGTYVKMDKIEVINLEDPTKNITLTDVSMRCQGTSSMDYPRKNFRFYTQKDSADTTVDQYTTRMFDYQGNELTGKQRVYAFKNNAQPVKTWCLKADYAESSSTHNTGVARLWNNALKNAKITNSKINPKHYVLDSFPNTDFPCRTLAQHYANEAENFNYDVRTTVDGFPITLFYHRTESEPLTFLGKYNWNNDKSTESVFGFCDIPGFDNTNMQCWEVIEGDFDINQFMSMSRWDLGKANGGWQNNFESRYPDDAGEPTEADRAESTLKPICEWIVSTRHSFSTANGDKFDYNAGVTHSGNITINGVSVPDNAANRQRKFVEEKWNHLDVYKIAAYYVYLMRMGGVDQTVKNAMFTTEDGEHWFYINYDNDTILGVRNDGRLKFDYTIDRQSKDPDNENAYAYAGHDSTLWNNLENDEEFMSIVAEVDQALFESGFNYPNVIDMFNNKQSAMWSERTHNLDYQYKYLDVWNYDKNPQLEKLQGPRRTHREWWLSHRFAIWDAKNMVGQYKNSFIQIKPLQLGNALSGECVKITPAVDNQIFGWREGTTGAPHVYNGIRGQELVYDFHEAGLQYAVGNTLTFQNVVYAEKFDCSKVSRIITELDFGNVNSDVFDSEITEIVMGTTTSVANTSMSSQGLMGLNAVKYLEKISVCNFNHPNFNTIDLSKNFYLREIDARGSNNLTSISYPEASPLETVLLPNSITGIQMKDLSLLETVEITGGPSNLRLLDIRNCKKFSESATWILNWINSMSDSQLDKSELYVDHVKWTLTMEELLKFGKIQNPVIKGEITVTNLTTAEQAEQLREIFGYNCFLSTNPAGLWIHGTATMTFWSPDIDEVTEGSDTQFAFTVITDKEGSVEYSITTSRSGVTIDSMGVLHVPLTNEVAKQAIISAKFIYKDGVTPSISSTKGIWIRPETYPTNGEITGNSTLQNDGEYFISIPDEYNGIVTSEWSLGGDVRNFFSVYYAGVQEDGTFFCTVRKIAGTQPMMEEGTLKFELRNRNETVVYTKTLSVIATNPDIIITRVANQPIMEALWNAFGSSGTVQSGIISNRDYVLQSEASQITSDMLNPSNNSTGSIFYAQRNNITHFEEFQHFIGLTTIPGWCFNGCIKMSIITFPEYVTLIDQYAFGGSGVISIVLPESVTTINIRGFYNCPNLVSFTGLGVITANRTFEGCSKLHDLDIRNLESSMSQDMFNGCSALEEIYTPKLREFDLWWYGSGGTPNLKKWTIGPITNTPNFGGQFLRKNITLVISRYCDNTSFVKNFYGMKAYEVEDGNPIFRIVNGCVVTPDTETIQMIPNQESVTFPSGYSIIGEAASRSNSLLKTVTIPSWITTIGAGAFRDCPSLTSINIPNNVTSIGNDICNNCQALTSFTWSSAVTIIPAGAFMNCSSLANINVPEGITRINENGFGGCTSATTIRLPSTLTYLMYRALQNCPNVTTIYSLNPTAPTANIHAGLNVTPFGSGYNGSTTNTDYTGYNTKNSGNNKLYVPSNATNYEAQQGWRNPLLNPDLSNFTIVYSL